jgi:hypothetical protein
MGPDGAEAFDAASVEGEKVDVLRESLYSSLCCVVVYTVFAVYSFLVLYKSQGLFDVLEAAERQALLATHQVAFILQLVCC